MKHMLSVSSYVYHVGNQSFSTKEKKNAISLSSQVIKERYPEFKSIVKEFALHNPLRYLQEIITFFQKNSGFLERPYFCMVGQVNNAKGIFVTIEAFGEVKKTHPQAALLIIGPIDEDYKEQIWRFTKKHSIKDVYCFGLSSNPLSLLRHANAYINSAKFEAFGRGTIEAMLLGVPVIAVNSGGSKELVKDGETGFLYEYGNTKQLAGIMMNKILSDNSDEKKQISKRAKDFALSLMSYEKYGYSILSTLQDAKKAHRSQKDLRPIIDLFISSFDEDYYKVTRQDVLHYFVSRKPYSYVFSGFSNISKVIKKYTGRMWS
jgi:glycosyltransferase involved in cell wall biosynthesis